MPFALSGGMAQRVLASLAMRTGSRVLIADEPTKGLDADRRAELTDLLAQLRDAGRALLVITHDLAVVRALGGQVAVLEDGSIAEQGTVAEVLGAPRSAFARACLAAEPTRWAAPPPGRRGDVVADAEGLVVGRGGCRLAGPLGFPLAAGTMTALLGPSGAGKTRWATRCSGCCRRSLAGSTGSVGGSIARPAATCARASRSCTRTRLRYFRPTAPSATASTICGGWRMAQTWCAAFPPCSIGWACPRVCWIVVRVR